MRAGPFFLITQIRGPLLKGIARNAAHHSHRDMGLFRAKRVSEGSPGSTVAKHTLGDRDGLFLLRTLGRGSIF